MRRFKNKVPLLELSNQGHRLAVSADGVQLPAEKNPSVVFKQLFTEPEGGIDSSVVGLTGGKVCLTLCCPMQILYPISWVSEDRGRLDQYLTAVREVEIRT